MQDAVFEGIDMQMVRSAVEHNLPYIAAKPLPELVADIRSFQGMIPDEARQKGADVFKDLVCNGLPRQSLEAALSADDIPAVVAMLMAAERTTASVPTVLIEMAVLLKQVGVSQYCGAERDMAPNQPGTAPIQPQ